MLNIPTDNLYKFLALGGMFTFVAAIYLFWSENNYIIDRIFEEELRLEILRAESAHYFKDKALLDEEITRLEEAVDHLSEDVARAKELADLAKTEDTPDDAQLPNISDDESMKNLDRLTTNADSITTAIEKISISNKKLLEINRNIELRYIELNHLIYKIKY